MSETKEKKQLKSKNWLFYAGLFFLVLLLVIFLVVIYLPQPYRQLSSQDNENAARGLCESRPINPSYSCTTNYVSVGVSPVQVSCECEIKNNKCQPKVCWAS